MESFGFNEHVAETESGFSPEAARTQERGILDKIMDGKLAKLGAAFIAISAMTGCDVRPKSESSAQTTAAAAAEKAETPDHVAAEHVQTQQQISPEIEKQTTLKKDTFEIPASPDIEGVTESGTWSTDMVDSMRSEFTELATQEDAHMFLQVTVNKYIGEYYMPTKGALKKGAYGLTTRSYADADFKLIAENNKIVQRIVEEVSTRFGVDASHAKEQLSDMVAHSTENTSYAAKKRREIINNGLKH